MSLKLQALGLSAEHAFTLGGFAGLLHTIELFVETNKPKAIALIQDLLLVIDPNSKLAIALRALLVILQPAT